MEIFFLKLLKMYKCIILYANKNREIKELDHGKLENLLGKITFVGAIPELEAFVVGSVNPVQQILNPFCKNKDYFEEDVRGDVILIGSDKNGNGIDLDCEKTNEFITSIE